MKTFIVVGVAMALTACAGVPLPQEQREIQFVESTALEKKENYQAALTYLAKSLGDSNVAIKVRDPEEGVIITQIAFRCDELRAFMDVNRHMVTFNLDFGAKDKKVRLVYEAMEDKIYSGLDGSYITTRYFTRPAEIASLKVCAEREKALLLQALSGQKRSSDW